MNVAVAAAAAWADYGGRGMCDLVDALFHVGYLDTDDKKVDVLDKMARHGALRDVEFTLAKIDPGITREHGCEILSAAAAGGKGRADVLKVPAKQRVGPERGELETQADGAVRGYTARGRRHGQGLVGGWSQDV